MVSVLTHFFVAFWITLQGTMVQSASMGKMAYDVRFRELTEYMTYRSTSQRLSRKVISYLLREEIRHDIHKPSIHCHIA